MNAPAYFAIQGRACQRPVLDTMLVKCRPTSLFEISGVFVYIWAWKIKYSLHDEASPNSELVQWYTFGFLLIIWRGTFWIDIADVVVCEWNRSMSKLGQTEPVFFNLWLLRSSRAPYSWMLKIKKNVEVLICCYRDLMLHYLTERSLKIIVQLYSNDKLS